MKYRSSIETSLKILTILTINKEYAQYDMDEAIGKDYHTILRHLKNLEKNRLIELKRSEPARKRGKDRKIYTLTTLGLITILGFEHIYDEIDEVANNYSSDLLLIFGKWQFFVDNGCRDQAVERLKDTMILVHKQMRTFPFLATELTPDYLLHVKERKSKLQKLGASDFALAFDVLDDINLDFLLAPLLSPFAVKIPLDIDELEKGLLPDFQRWIKTLLKDKELKAYVESKLSIERKYRKNALEAMDSWLDYWKKQV